MTGGFTGVGSMPSFDKPMLVAAPGVNVPKKKKDKTTHVHEAAQWMVRCLLDEEDQKAT